MQIYDRVIYYDDPFMIMEYLPKTLAKVMRSGPSILEKVTYAFQLMSALDYLHAHKPSIIHRDIKPANIFIKGGSCVLGDFGLMKLVNEDEEEDKEFLKESIGAGMPFYYRTPDLVDYLNNVASITTKSDIFQLGLVLAQLFTGWNPAKAAKNFTDPVELEPLSTIRSRLGVTRSAQPYPPAPPATPAQGTTGRRDVPVSLRRARRGDGWPSAPPRAAGSARGRLVSVNAL